MNQKKKPGLAEVLGSLIALFIFGFVGGVGFDLGASLFNGAL